MRSSARWIGCVATALLLSGCVEETKKVQPGHVTVKVAPTKTAQAKVAPTKDAQAKDAAGKDITMLPATGDRSQYLSVDVCAEQLHELSGLLLEYYALYARLPDKLSDLLPLATGDHKPSLICPVSHEEYVYDPNGPQLEGAGRVVVYDAKPVHGGFRWGIGVVAPQPHQPLTCKVIKVPETALK